MGGSRQVHRAARLRPPPASSKRDWHCEAPRRRTRRRIVGSLGRLLHLLAGAGFRVLVFGATGRLAVVRIGRRHSSSPPLMNEWHHEKTVHRRYRSRDQQHRRRLHSAGQAQVELFEIEQLVGPGQVAARPLLPSVRYHPAAGEIAAGELQLPWTRRMRSEQVITGRLALDLGAQVPGRLVAAPRAGCRTPRSTAWRRSCPGAPTAMSSRFRRSRPARAIWRMSAPPGSTASRRRHSNSSN
jgi:hypothetical protein